MKFGLFDFDNEDALISRFVDWWMSFLVTRILPLMTFVMIVLLFVTVVCTVLEVIRKQPQ